MVSAVLSEAYVYFLGLGMQTPISTWGNMMGNCQSFMSQGTRWVWVFPGLFFVLVILSVNLLGDDLRDTSTRTAPATFKQSPSNIASSDLHKGQICSSIWRSRSLP
jgi:hypothetical protein